jgi:hypothetical protein
LHALHVNPDTIAGHDIRRLAVVSPLIETPRAMT